MRYLATFVTSAMLALTLTSGASAHLIKTMNKGTASTKVQSAKKNLNHARGACKAHRRTQTANSPRSHCAALPWLERSIERFWLKYWIGRQIWLAETIGPLHADAWPNCPDPFDSRSYTWYDTVECENGGWWYDGPGFYRCGLQFHPGWERKYRVQVCPYRR